MTCDCWQRIINAQPGEPVEVCDLAWHVMRFFSGLNATQGDPHREPEGEVVDVGD